MEHRPIVRSKTMKYGEGNWGAHFPKLGLGNGFLAIILNTPWNDKIDVLDLVKIKNSVANDIIKTVNRQSTEWEKIVANFVFNIRLNTQRPLIEMSQWNLLYNCYRSFLKTLSLVYNSVKRVFK
jgi:hypothetical protein